MLLAGSIELEATIFLRLVMATYFELIGFYLELFSGIFLR